MTAIAAGLRGASRCIVAHPVNPPHVIPAVEVLAGKDTSPDIVTRTCEFLSSVGQTPVLLRKYAVGFALNRMQAALVREAIDLVESGIADINGVDALIRDGLGLRWALLGPFGVGHGNADGGLREYYAKYGAAYVSLMEDLDNRVPSFTPQMVDRFATETERMEGAPSHVPTILRWRDRLIRRIRALKAEDPHP
jgi:3-hydroxyacyl-CoA dehydrogenase